MSEPRRTEPELGEDLHAEVAVPLRDWVVPWPLLPLMQPGMLRGRAPAIVDPIVEPLWSGTRIVVHFAADPEGGVGNLALSDQLGQPVEIEQTDVAIALRDAIAADEAIIDGILTEQALRSGAGTSPVLETSQRVLWSTGVDAIRRDPYLNPQLAFVGTDLLHLDGQSLLDVPLLERKRLLDSVLISGAQVRISAFVRPPVDPWLLSWKAAGFKGVMLKSANSRYEPGKRTYHWRAVTTIGRHR